MKNYVVAVLALLAGCATKTPPPPPVPSIDRPAAAPVDVGIDWGWRVVGDAAVRPVQVFSKHGQTYMQMRDRRLVVLVVNGEVVPHMTSWPYLVIQGSPDQVDVVADGYRAIAERTSFEQDGQPPQPATPVAPVAQETSRIERVKIK